MDRVGASRPGASRRRALGWTTFRAKRERKSSGREMASVSKAKRRALAGSRSPFAGQTSLGQRSPWSLARFSKNRRRDKKPISNATSISRMAAQCRAAHCPLPLDHRNGRLLGACRLWPELSAAIAGVGGADIHCLSLAVVGTNTA